MQFKFSEEQCRNATWVWQTRQFMKMAEQVVFQFIQKFEKAGQK
jgi:hypothetical protein